MIRLPTAFASGLLVLLGGCGSEPVPIAKALKVLSDQLSSDQYEDTAAGLSDNEVELDEYKCVLKSYQDSQKSADPVVPVLTNPITLTVAGEFSSGATLSLTFPTVGFAPTAAEKQDQTVGVPLTFSRLSGLPNVWLQDRLTPISNLSNDQKQEFVSDHQILKDYDKLSNLIQVVIKGYKAPPSPSALQPSHNPLQRNLADAYFPRPPATCAKKP